jgi:hypothetical protein
LSHRIALLPSVQSERRSTASTVAPRRTPPRPAEPRTHLEFERVAWE